MQSTPAALRPAPSPDALAPVDVHRSDARLWMRARTGSTPVSTGCARPATSRAEAGPGPASICISAVRSAVRAAKRVIRRSVDRPGRLARRDPCAQRGATATLTAPSTARQRSGAPSGRGGGGRSGTSLRRGSARHPRRGGSMSGRNRPGLRRRRFLGYAGRSLWTVSLRLAVCAARLRRPRRGGGPVCSDQLPGHRGTASRRVRPSRARPPTGGCAPPMSCSGSTS